MQQAEEEVTDKRVTDKKAAGRGCEAKEDTEKQSLVRKQCVIEK